MSNLSGMMPLEQFKRICKLDSIDFIQGKGRAFTSTPVGKLFAAQKLDTSKPMYVCVAENIPGKPDLDGSLWLVNSNGLKAAFTV